MLENDGDFHQAKIFLQPPGSGELSDEDSGDEDIVELHHLSRRQLISQADFEIDYGSHIQSSCDDVITEDIGTMVEVDCEPGNKEATLLSGTNSSGLNEPFPETESSDRAQIDESLSEQPGNAEFLPFLRFFIPQSQIYWILDP